MGSRQLIVTPNLNLSSTTDFRNYHCVSSRFYVGSCPRVVVTDVDMIKEITVKKFENFMDRGYVVSNKQVT